MAAQTTFTSQTYSALRLSRARGLRRLGHTDPGRPSAAKSLLCPSRNRGAEVELGLWGAKSACESDQAKTLL